MPFKNSGYLRPWVFSVVLIAGCSKSLTHSDSDLSANIIAQPTSLFTTDPTLSPSYGDSILYVTGTGRAAYLFKPVNTLANGKFVAWPAGLTIDPNTGEIDILLSEPGSRYNVGFVNAGTGDTAYRQIVLAGLTYPDGIYYVNASDSVLHPFYNAGAAFRTPDVRFDEAGPEGLRPADQKLIVNTGTGTIDLKQSMEQGLFGSNPQNGDTRDITLYYRLDDQSNRSLLKSKVLVHYYNTLSDVPEDLLTACLNSQSIYRQLAQPTKTTTAAATTTTATAGATTAPVASAPPSKNAKPTPVPAPPRPPQVIIVNSGHH